MRGKLKVVDDRDDDHDPAVSTQAQIDAASAFQFRQDRDDALETERAANVVRFSGGSPGTRTYHLSVGVSAADNHVAINEMLPQKLNLVRGDLVGYNWPDPHNVHTVGFQPPNRRCLGPSARHGA
jgi:hypothetical protein